MRFSPNLLKSLQPEVDYQGLMAQMPGLSHPRRKLKELQNSGTLIRLKKGFYVFSNDFLGKSYSREIASNLLYGPSYISFEYALSFYGLIPERVEVLTSVTSRKNKAFQTPIGAFTYRHLSPALYPLAVTIKNGPDGRPFIIASAEKALLDMFTLRFKKAARPSSRDIRSALEEDLRINTDLLARTVNRSTIALMREPYKNRRWSKLFIDFCLEKL